MSDRYLLAKDIVNGQEGKAFATIDGRNEELFYVKKVDADFEFTKKSFKVAGKRGEQNKTTGWKGTGTMTIYSITTIYKKMAENYAKNGIVPYFDITVTNEDPTSTVGKQTVVLRNVCPDKVKLALFDVESEGLEEDIGFTFDDFDILDEFGRPVNFQD